MTLLRKTAIAGVLIAAFLALIGFNAADKPGDSNLRDYGPAPEFTGIEQWLNSEPLTLARLRGKVVLINFWTYSCINCLRTLPHITRWYDTYKDKGFVIVGVHTPEFAFEHRARNVQTEMQRFRIHYPVAQDNQYATWKAYHNKYWPAAYLVDQKGRIVLKHFGEGHYQEMENAIRALLAAGPPVAAKGSGTDLKQAGSPEMYFGMSRLQNLASPETPARDERRYSAPATLPLNTFALVGAWTLDLENAALAQNGGEVLLRFRAGKVHLVAGSASPVVVSVTVDGKAQPPVTIEDSRLYTLFDSDDYGEHLLRLKIPKAGFSAFSFTFG